MFSLTYTILNKFDFYVSAVYIISLFIFLNKYFSYSYFSYILNINSLYLFKDEFSLNYFKQFPQILDATQRFLFPLLCVETLL